MEGQHQLRFSRKPPQRLFFLHRPSSEGLLQFYRAAAESILTFPITVWLGGVSAEEERQPKEAARTASEIAGCEVPSPPEI